MTNDEPKGAEADQSAALALRPDAAHAYIERAFARCDRAVPDVEGALADLDRAVALGERGAPAALPAPFRERPRDVLRRLPASAPSLEARPHVPRLDALRDRIARLKSQRARAP